MVDKWEYCVVYGGWNQETYVYFLRDDYEQGYEEKYYNQPGVQTTFKIVAELGHQGWELTNVAPKFGGATDPVKCTFSHNIWFLKRRVA